MTGTGRASCRNAGLFLTGSRSLFNFLEKTILSLSSAHLQPADKRRAAQGVVAAATMDGYSGYHTSGVGGGIWLNPCVGGRVSIRFGSVLRARTWSCWPGPSPPRPCVGGRASIRFGSVLRARTLPH